MVEKDEREDVKAKNDKAGGKAFGKRDFNTFRCRRVPHASCESLPRQGVRAGGRRKPCEPPRASGLVAQTATPAVKADREDRNRHTDKWKCDEGLRPPLGI